MRISEWSSDVCSTETDPVAAIREAPVYTVWHTRELADLLDWIRAWNAGAAHPVRIAGVDVQDVSHDLDDALHRLKAIDAGTEARLRLRMSDWQIGRAHVCTPVTNANIVCR